MTALLTRGLLNTAGVDDALSTMQMQSLLVVADATEILAIAGCVFGYQFVDAARCAVWNGCGVRSSCDYGGSNADEVYRIVLHLGNTGDVDAVRRNFGP